jgi:hypothetical protein
VAHVFELGEPGDGAGPQGGDGGGGRNAAGGTRVVPVMRRPSLRQRRRGAEHVGPPVSDGVVAVAAGGVPGGAGLGVTGLPAAAVLLAGAAIIRRGVKAIGVPMYIMIHADAASIRLALGQLTSPA